MITGIASRSRSHRDRMQNVWPDGLSWLEHCLIAEHEFCRGFDEATGIMKQ